MLNLIFIFSRFSNTCINTDLDSGENNDGPQYMERCKVYDKHPRYQYSINYINCMFCILKKVIKGPILPIFIINSSTRERHVTTHQSSGQYTNKKYNPVIIYINSKCRRGLMKYINTMLSLFLCIAYCVYSIAMTIATNPNTVLTQGRSTVHVESWLMKNIH